MTPIDWLDMPQRLSKAEDKVKALTIEVEALRAIVVEQAIEIKRCHDGMAIGRSAEGEMGVEARWVSVANS